MSYLLHPPLLDETGLSEALRWYIQGLAERSGLEIVLDIAANFERLPREMELVMFRLVQECLTNVTRHAHASRVRLQIACAPDARELSLVVADDGVGIEPSGTKRSGLGLAGLRERVEVLGGRLEVLSSPPHGVEIRVRIPLSGPRP